MSRRNDLTEAAIGHVRNRQVLARLGALPRALLGG